MNPEDDSNLISRFFSRELKAEERTAFEQKLNDDPSFARKVQMHRQVKEMVDQAYDDGQKEAWKTEWKNELGAYKNRRLLMRVLFGVIGIAVLALLWFFIFPPPVSITPSLVEPAPGPTAGIDIKKEWEKSPPLNYGKDRGVDTSADSQYRSLLVESFDYYSNENYDSAIITLEPFVEGTPYLEDAHLLRGLSMYGLGQQKEALAEMEAIILSEKERKKGHALWYAALIHLEFEEKDKSINYLEQIINKPYAAASQAKALLNKIQNVE